MAISGNELDPAKPAEAAALDADRLAAVVAKAYAAIADPGSLIALLHEMVDDETMLEAVDIGTQMHFQNAEQLFDKLHPMGDADYSALRTHLATEIECDLALDPALRILAVNTGLFDETLASGEGLPDWLFDPVREAADRKRLKAIENPEARIFLRLFTGPDDENGRWFNAFRSDVGSRNMIALQAVRLRWDRRTGSAFRDAFELTETELLLTRHLVTGGTVRGFAESRGRSVGTARNQLKALQRKLAIKSKDELLLLYAGFVHSLDPGGEFGDIYQHSCENLFEDGRGGRIAWEEMGDPRGLPVVYFHPLEGALLTEAVEQVARQKGLRILAPWRPHFGETTGSQASTETPVRFARRLAHWLDHLGIERCAAFAAHAGAPYMMAFVQENRERTIGFCGAAAFLPIVETGDLQFVRPNYRIHFRTARAAPGFARVYMRALLASIRTGDFHHFVEEFYRGCEPELAVLQRGDFVRMCRKTANYSLTDSPGGPIDTNINWAADWSGYFDEDPVPHAILYGSLDANVPKAFARLSCKRFGLDAPQFIEGAGAFLMQEQPGIVFDAIRALFDRPE